MPDRYLRACQVSMMSAHVLLMIMVAVDGTMNACTKDDSD